MPLKPKTHSWLVWEEQNSGIARFLLGGEFVSITEEEKST